MTILDTSIVVPFVRRADSTIVRRLAEELGDADIFVTSITELELFQGARDEAEWTKIAQFLSHQEIILPTPVTWRNAARTYFDLRRIGQTVRSSFDCLIAEIAIGKNMLLVHNDRDFEAIASIRPLKQRRIDFAQGPP